MKMKLDILLSIANDGIYRIRDLLLKPLNNIRYIISHQIFNGKKYNIKFNRDDVIYKPSNTKGLSINRNITLSMASADICLLADADVSYEKEYFFRIIDAFKKNPEADIITFQIKTDIIESMVKSYPNFSHWHNIRTVFQVTSIEIAFKLDIIKLNKIKFDENFGKGSVFNFAEENIFLIDSLRKELRIKFIPTNIVVYNNIVPLKSLTDNNIITIGAILYRMFNIFSIIWYFYSAIYNYGKYKEDKSILKYLTLTFRGGLLASKLNHHGGSLLANLKLFLRQLKGLDYNFINFNRDNLSRKTFF